MGDVAAGSYHCAGVGVLCAVRGAGPSLGRGPGWRLAPSQLHNPKYCLLWSTEDRILAFSGWRYWHFQKMNTGVDSVGFFHTQAHTLRFTPSHSLPSSRRVNVSGFGIYAFEVPGASIWEVMTGRVRGRWRGGVRLGICLEIKETRLTEMERKKRTLCCDEGCRDGIGNERPHIKMFLDQEHRFVGAWIGAVITGEELASLGRSSEL